MNNEINFFELRYILSDYVLFVSILVLLCWSCTCVNRMIFIFNLVYHLLNIGENTGLTEEPACACKPPYNNIKLRLGKERGVIQWYLRRVCKSVLEVRIIRSQSLSVEISFIFLVYQIILSKLSQSLKSRIFISIRRSPIRLVTLRFHRNSQTSRFEYSVLIL